MIINFPKTMRFATAPWLEWLTAGLCLLIAIVLAFALRRPDFNWQIALSGWSPIDWVAHLRFPDRYQLDFPNGMNLYEKSSVMHVYPFLNRAFDIPVNSIIPAMIFLEMVFMAGASLFFARSLNWVVSPIGACLFALLVVVSPARDLDLSHFGAPFFWGLHYNFADACRLLGVAFFLRRQPLLGAVMLGVGFSIHPLIALFGCAFVAGFVVVERSWVGLRSLAVCVLAFLVISVGWLVYSYDFSSIVSTQMDAQVWIRMARAFSYHFFPIDYGLLTLDFHKRLLPLLVLCLLALHYLPVVCPDRGLRRGLIGGCLVLVLLIAGGLAISVYAPSPLLIKLALPRASALLICIAMAICCIGLVRDIQSGTLLPRILGLLIVVSPFVYPPGFPLIPVSLLILVSRRGFGVGEEARHQRAELVALALVLAVVFTYWLAGLVQPHNLPSYTGYLAQFNYWQLVAISGLLLTFLYLFHRHAMSYRMSNGRLTGVASRFGPLVVFVVACYLSLSWQRALVPDPAYRAFGASYLDAQRWAKSSTPEQSLFMVDPTIAYGWRDYSERSSFGNLREWLHTSWLYDSRADRYRAGLQRFAEFGVPLDPYLEQPVSHLQGYRKLNADIEKRFYDLDEEWFSSMRQRYAVSHVVMRKDSVVRYYSFDKVFENQHFVIFDLSE